MNNPPDGIVTFLFTDIEGSTRMAQQFPDKLQTELDKHHSILRESIQSNNGYIYEIIGDAFCAAFSGAKNAVISAIDIQRKLLSEKWEVVPIKVRMGIHTGHIEWTGKRYIGYLTLARTHRVMSIAYGGQILLSNDSLNFFSNETKDQIAGNITFRDLGERRLKDLLKPERIYQVVSDGIESDFPPLKTLDARPNNLPVQSTSFVGRKSELKEIKELTGKVRLLTLLGPGGTGKTRLSIAAGENLIDDFSNGVWFVDLSIFSKPGFVVNAIAQSLKITEEKDKSIEQSLIEFIGKKQMLIILDNCEHLIDECARVTEKLLGHCSGLKIIATSREAFKIKGETIYILSTLSLPNPKTDKTLDILTQFESVRLFIDRALEVNPKFEVNNDNAPAISEICYQLEGIPLAIELAAARINVLSVEKILERLIDRFKLLTGGSRTSLPRQQTLRALVDWSYDLLSDDEKTLWNRLSIFKGGWDLNSAEEICSDEKINKDDILDLITNLAKKSIVIYDEHKEKYRMLETLRQYGLENFKKSEDEKLFKKNHLLYFMSLAETLENGLNGSGQLVSLEKFESAHLNFQTAMSLSNFEENKEFTVRLVIAMCRFWIVRGYLDLMNRLSEIAMQYSEDVDDIIRAKLLSAAGHVKRIFGEFKAARKLYEESLSLRTAAGDKSGISDSYNSLGTNEMDIGDNKQALIYYELCLEQKRELNDKRGIAHSLNNIAFILVKVGEYKRARAMLEECLELRTGLDDKRGIAATLINLGYEAYNTGEFNRAEKYFERALIICRELNDKQGIINCYINLAGLAIDQGEIEQAQKILSDSIQISNEAGDNQSLAFSYQEAGHLEIEKGNNEKALDFYEKSYAARKEIGDKSGMLNSAGNIGRVLLETGNLDRAEKYLNESLELGYETIEKPAIADTFASLGKLEFERKQFDKSAKHYEVSLKLRLELGDLMNLASTTILIAEYYTDNGNLEKAALLIGAADNIHKNISAIPNRIERNRFEKVKSKLMKSMSSSDFEKYFKEGIRKSPDKISAIAIPIITTEH